MVVESDDDGVTDAKEKAECHLVNSLSTTVEDDPENDGLVLVVVSVMVVDQ